MLQTAPLKRADERGHKFENSCGYSAVSSTSMGKDKGKYWNRSEGIGKTSGDEWSFASSNLWSTLSEALESRITFLFKPKEEKRIMLGTSTAETKATVPYSILAKHNTWDPLRRSIYCASDCGNQN